MSFFADDCVLEMPRARAVGASTAGREGWHRQPLRRDARRPLRRRSPLGQWHRGCSEWLLTGPSTAGGGNTERGGGGGGGGGGRVQKIDSYVRSPDRPRRPRAQPPQRRPRPAPRQAHRLHRPVRLGQVVAGVRHDLRRGPAPVRRVAVGLRPAVPRPDGQARRRLHRGLSPAISIDQKSAGRNPRSTVGTITEIYDYLRLLFARIGVPHCPECGAADHPPDPAADRRPHPGAARGHPVPGAGAGGAGAARAPTRPCSPDLAGPGLRPARVDGELVEIGADETSSWPATSSTPSRSSSTGWCSARASSGGSPTPSRRRWRWPTASPRSRSCAETARCWPTGGDPHLLPAPGLPQRPRQLRGAGPRNFSFNSPYGACERCDGLGTRYEVDPASWSCPTPTSPRRRRHRPVGERPRHLLPAAGRGGVRGAGIPTDVPWRAHRQAAEAAAPRHRRQEGESSSSTRTATGAPAPTTPATRA